MLRRSILAILAATVLHSAAFAQMSHKHGADTACDDVALRCASKVTPAFAPDGTLVLTWMTGGHILVASSTDLGRTFSDPVRVTRDTMNLDWGPDARPKIAITKTGVVTLAFSTFRDKAFNGQVFTTTSRDGGRSFADIKPITSNIESQRFEAIGFDTDGTLFAAWLDKRGRVPAQQRGETYEGAGLFFASSKDGGETYSEATLATDNTCECCRLGLAFAGPGQPAIAFRNIFEGGVRDHAVITFDTPSTPGRLRRVSTDDWKIAACPHHGPSLAISPAGTYHVTWYTAGKARKGLFYARSQDQGETFSQPVAIGQPGRNPARAYVLASAETTTIVWKEFDGERTSVSRMTSHDDGKTWSPPAVIATTTDTSDHPLLVADSKRIFLSWMTKADGYIFQLIEGGS